MLASILIIIFIFILLLPLLLKKVEHNLELFLFIMGGIALMLSHLLGPEPLLNMRFIGSVFMEPIKITIATLVFGLVFRALRERMKRMIVTTELSAGAAIIRVPAYIVSRIAVERDHGDHRGPGPVRDGELHQPR